MPKVRRKTRASYRDRGQTGDSQPYDRDSSQTAARAAASATRAMASTGGEEPHPAIVTPSHSDVATVIEESRSSKRRRKSKQRFRNGIEPSLAGSSPIAEPSPLQAEVATIGKSTTKPLATINATDDGIMVAQPAGAVTSSESSAPATSDTATFDTQLVVLQRQVIECQAASEQTITAFRLHVEELEKERDQSTREIASVKEKLAAKENALRSHDSKFAEVIEALSCGVCFEPLDDPHVLSCGHTACRRCLLQWFRSPNAYPADDITSVADGDDLTYRTKVCHLCREPVFRRPTRMFAFQNVIDLIRTGESLREEPPRFSSDIWENTFPQDPTEHFFWDGEDDVPRCPACGYEVTLGECNQCGAEFSVSGDDMDDLGEMSDDDGDSLDSQGDVDGQDPGTASELDDMLEGDRGQTGTGGRLGDGHMSRLGALLDNLVEAGSGRSAGSDDSGDSDDSDGGGWSAEDALIAFEGYGSPPTTGAQVQAAFDRHLRNQRRAAEGGRDSDDSDDDDDWRDPREARNRRNPAAVEAPRRGRIRHRSLEALYSDLEETGITIEEDVDGYESSFINDSDGAAAEDVSDGDDDSEPDEPKDEEADEPSVEELRRRRAARYSHPAEPDNPEPRAPGRSRRGRIVVSDSE